MSNVQTVPTAQSQDAPDDDQLLTVADICGRIGVHQQTGYGWIRSGALAAIKFGTRIGYRIRLGDDEDFLLRRTLTGAIAAQLLRSASAAPDS
jgi:excisionase family DNA binding protein